MFKQGNDQIKVGGRVEERGGQVLEVAQSTTSHMGSMQKAQNTIHSSFGSLQGQKLYSFFKKPVPTFGLPVHTCKLLLGSLEDFSRLN